jgi:hypothetical protein
MNDPLDDFEEQRLVLQHRKATWNHTQGLSVQVLEKHFDPAFQAELRDELDRYHKEDQPEKYIPIPSTKLRRFNQKQVRAKLQVKLQEPGHFDQRPFGSVTINGERFRVIFQSYQLMMTDLWQCSQKEWRQWIYRTWNDHFKNIDAVVDPTNANQMYPTSALYFDYDQFGNSHPEVENAFVIVTYTDDGLLKLNGAVLILDKCVKVFQKPRRTKNGWTAAISG